MTKMTAPDGSKRLFLIFLHVITNYYSKQNNN